MTGVYFHLDSSWNINGKRYDFEKSGKVEMRKSKVYTICIGLSLKFLHIWFYIIRLVCYCVTIKMSIAGKYTYTGQCVFIVCYYVFRWS